VAKQLARQSEQERKAFKQLCAKTFTCEPDARQALETGSADREANMSTFAKAALDLLAECIKASR
jgi:uncharacterized tellurite resistance protein B-like protein